MFKGIITAAITPYIKGRVDLNGFEKFLQWQYKEGIRSVVICGCTGEATCLTAEEKINMLSVATEVKNNYKDLQIIFGIANGRLSVAIDEAMIAEDKGADAVMVMCPAYNKPNQQGLYKYFESINHSINLPIIIYNSPSRTGTDIKDETIANLSKLRNITAIKDSTADLSRPLYLQSILPEGSDFRMLGADDILMPAFYVNGGSGCISVVSNIIPSAFNKVYDLISKGDFKEAITLHHKFIKLYKILFCDTNPIPVKYAAYLMGLISSAEVRLPLTDLPNKLKSEMKSVLNSLGII